MFFLKRTFVLKQAHISTILELVIDTCWRILWKSNV